MGNQNASFEEPTIRGRHLSVPREDTCAPVSALVNFCSQQLDFYPEFRCFMMEDGFMVAIYFPNEQFVCQAVERSKKTASENAAKRASSRLNNEDEFLAGLIKP